MRECPPPHTSLPQVRTSGTGWSVGLPLCLPGPGPPGRAGPESRAEVLLSSPPALTAPTPLCRASWTLRDSECGGGSALQSGWVSPAGPPDLPSGLSSFPSPYQKALSQAPCPRPLGSRTQRPLLVQQLGSAVGVSVQRRGVGSSSRGFRVGGGPHSPGIIPDLGPGHSVNHGVDGGTVNT